MGPARVGLGIAEQDHGDVEGQHTEKQPTGFLQEAGNLLRKGKRTGGRTIEHEWVRGRYRAMQKNESEKSKSAAFTAL
jgi:hypothetical protein